jgi:redox-sensitive bicupin YhaK (pirin superfamily)
VSRGIEPAAFSDPFLLMAEDWVPRDAFSPHPHRGIETVTLVLDGALEHIDSASIRRAAARSSAAEYSSRVIATVIAIPFA